jgi:hypothetical protein
MALGGDEQPGFFASLNTGPLGRPESTQPIAKNANVEIDLDLDEARLVVELMADGRLRAPVQATRELLRDRLRKAEVLRTGREWAVLRTLEDTPPRAAKDAEANREVVAAGVIGEGGMSVIDFIGFLATGLQTGVMTASEGDIERSVYFFRGDVVWASSTSPADRLGEFLLARGKITREQLQIAVRDGERRIGRACVERGFFAAHELYAVVQAQLTEIFDRLLATEKGVWSFSRISSSQIADSQIHLSTQGLLVDAMRRLDEMNIYRQRIRTAEVIIQRAGKPQRNATSTDTADLVGQLDENLREGAKELLRVLPGSATVSELMRLLGKGEFEVTRLAYHLLRRGSLELVTAGETGPIPRRVSALSKTEASEVIGIYSMAIREMFHEVARVGRAEALSSAANGFLHDASTTYANLLRSCALQPDGSLDEHALVAALQGLSLGAQELSDALSELLFFVLFQATEYLGRRRGDDLARRVKLILGMLSHTGVTRDGGDQS